MVIPLLGGIEEMNRSGALVLLAFAPFLRKSLFGLKPMIEGSIFRETAFFGDAVGLDLDRVVVCR
jgi:hypothetical protein